MTKEKVPCRFLRKAGMGASEALWGRAFYVRAGPAVRTELPNEPLTCEH